MPSREIQWFPGHMAKTRRLIAASLGDVDAVIELLDARVPRSSRNPEIKRLIGSKPHLILLNKATLADPEANARWMRTFAAEGGVLLTDCVTGEGVDRIASELRRLCADKLQRWEEKGMTGRRLRAMVVGIPNCGKSTLVNRLAGAKKAKTENRPGVTLTKQWVPTNIGIDLLDMPGVLWPKFDDRRVGENLAMTGAVRDAILDKTELAVTLCSRLRTLYPELLKTRYKLGDISDLDDYDLFLEIGRKRGFLMSGGVVNEDRTADILLDEFRAAKIGRISLESPDGRADNGSADITGADAEQETTNAPADGSRESGDD